MKKMWKIVAVLVALIMSITFVGCGDNSEDMLSTYYTVTFDANGGEGSMAAQKFIIGEAQSLQANAFTRTDYSFTGWNTKKDGSGTDYADETIVKNLATTNGATVTLYAHWTSNNDTNKDNDYITKYYTVTFNSNNGTLVNPQTVENGTTATEPIAPTLDGYIFDGWYYGDMLFDFSTPITMNITLYAHWTSNNDTNKDNDYITKYYTVTFNSNNGTLVNPQTVENGTTATEPIAPTLDGYIFDGWYYGDMLFDFSTPIIMNITLAAHWTSIDNKDDIPPNEDSGNTDNDEKPQYVWLSLEHSYYFNSSNGNNTNGRGTQEWVYYNNALDYKYI
ncbi:MAG: InlB B-repeat-containing protein [Treponemataceae bacterium]|nr:InlB B-repeat-containing protein [Treponemataceae bacterium]